MAYLGKGLNDIATANVSVDTMTGDGSDTTLALSAGTKGIGSVNDVSVFISGIQQRPNIDYTLSAGVITFTTAPLIGQTVCAISHSDSWQDNVADSSVVTESFADLAITDAKIIGLNSSKLTGAMPAISGASLTGITETTNSASDPAIDTNGTLGDIWVNTTSGEMFILTDATTDNNVWYNVGGGTDNVQPNSYGFNSGGGGNSLAGYYTNMIERFTFASSSTNTDWGDLTIAKDNGVGSSSTTHGYATSGSVQVTPKNGDTIEKFAVASQSNATDVGNLSANRDSVGGNYSTTNGYVTHGRQFVAPNVYTYHRAIQKFSYSSDADGTSVGDISGVTKYHIGQGSNSSTHGYSNGGRTSSNTVTSDINKFQFSNESTTASHGDLSFAKRIQSGSSSSTDGYSSGGLNSVHAPQILIDKFSFASNTTATSHGSLSETCYGGGASYTADECVIAQGYGAGHIATKQKFSFASNTTAEDIGDLTLAVGHPYGHGLAR